MNPLDLIKKIVLGILHQDGIIHAYQDPESADHVRLEAKVHKSVLQDILAALPKDGAGRSG